MALAASKSVVIAVALGILAAIVVVATTQYLASGNSFLASPGPLVSSEHPEDSRDDGHAAAFWPRGLLAWGCSQITGGEAGTLTRSDAQSYSGSNLMLSQGGYVSKRLLECWRGTTAEQPAEWRVLSFAGLMEAYHRDHIDICLTWENQTLKLTDQQYSCAGCSYSPDHRSSYRVASATGDEVTLAEEDSAGPMSGKGLAYFKLNQDDTVDEQIDQTNYFSGLPAIQVRTTAHLRRKGG